ncbi:efflux RND transporter periplasmic adaptor subunit [Rhizobium sp. P40RR-XXII]|uniref:efflux RND transporter periplasmic adaptor subunit n=1 Tax=Rhizobium sp. P40RR-XXII TaxID=2726739 RepID=UPI0014578BD3|nr:efflux RND transporter periplasmic adaptor subunit [Rhizobium sp. P40RR-XXII]NLS20701.1 efflux RND transporter periplasmic adaptor subunit [Rhizobium sp. P40RR-XXII]
MNRKILLASVGILVAAGATAFVLLAESSEGRAQAADPRVVPPLVSVVDAKRPDTTVRTFTGTIAARVQSNLGFRVPGKIIERYVDVGQQVKAGQPLMRIDETDLNLALAAKRNAVAAAQAVRTQAQADERRYAALVKNGLAAASPQRYEQAKAALDTATAQLAAAEADARVAENAATYSLLMADTDGTVVETLGEPGQVVAAGQTVIRLAQAGPREALVWLPESTRPQIGDEAEASIYGSESRQDKARLRQISDAADPQTRTYEARWVLDGTAASAPLGATVTIKISNDTGLAHAVVPVGAVFDDGSRTGVWVFDQKTSTVHFRQVKIEKMGEEVAVVSSLKAGEPIVALGAHLLQDGASVRTTTEQAEATNQ